MSGLRPCIHYLKQVSWIFFFFFFFLISKLHMYAVGLEAKTLPSTLLLHKEEVPFELELLGKFPFLDK